MKTMRKIRPARPAREPAAPVPRADDPPPESNAAAAFPTACRTGRRSLADPSACERDLSAAEREFMDAMQHYKRRSGRMFPTWSEVLEVLQGLGYEKASPAGEPTPWRATAGGAS